MWSKLGLSMDFFAIGDIVTEPFIRLKDARVTCRIDDEDCEISMRWGDKIPYEYSILVPAVGNSPNAAVAAARLGLSTGLRSYVGNDAYGKECLAVLKREKITTKYMVTEKGKQTNYHYVLWFESERTILVKHEEFSYTVPKLQKSPKWFYLSSLSDNSLPYHEALLEFFNKHPDSKLAFQPGTFQMKLGVEALKGLYERTDLFFCNKEEAERILKLPEGQDMATLLESVRALGPKSVVITDGRKGAYAHDGTEKLFIPMYPDDRPPFERTGAGDAFASTVTAALALGIPFKEALLWGPINSMAVVQEVGAQKGLLTRKVIEEYLQKAPASYAITPL